MHAETEERGSMVVQENDQYLEAVSSYGLHL